MGVAPVLPLAQGGLAAVIRLCTHRFASISAWTAAILSPIQRMTGTAMLFPKALYLAESEAGFPLWGTSVQPSGNP